MKPERILLDMDGVLADYYAGICREFGHVPWPYRCRPGDWNFFSGAPLCLTNNDVAPHMGREFYAALDPLPDAFELVAGCAEMVGERNVYLLTSPWDTDGCHAGKVDWVRKHLPGYLRRLMIGSPKELCSSPGAVLVDDSDVNCAKFAGVRNPGRAVLLPRPWNNRYAESSSECGRVLDVNAIIREVEG